MTFEKNKEVSLSKTETMVNGMCSRMEITENTVKLLMNIDFPPGNTEMVL